MSPSLMRSTSLAVMLSAALVGAANDVGAAKPQYGGPRSAMQLDEGAQDAWRRNGRRPATPERTEWVRQVRAQLQALKSLSFCRGDMQGTLVQGTVSDRNADHPVSIATGFAIIAPMVEILHGGTGPALRTRARLGRLGWWWSGRATLEKLYDESMARGLSWQEVEGKGKAAHATGLAVPTAELPQLLAQVAARPRPARTTTAQASSFGPWAATPTSTTGLFGSERGGSMFDPWPSPPPRRRYRDPSPRPAVPLKTLEGMATGREALWALESIGQSPEIKPLLARLPPGQGLLLSMINGGPGVFGAAPPADAIPGYGGAGLFSSGYGGNIQRLLYLDREGNPWIRIYDHTHHHHPIDDPVDAWLDGTAEWGNGERLDLHRAFPDFDTAEKVVRATQSSITHPRQIRAGYKDVYDVVADQDL